MIDLQHLILCGFVLEAGAAIRDRTSTAPYPGLWDVRGDVVYPSTDAADWFYHDLPENERRRWMEELKEKYMPLGSFTSPTRFTAWRDVRTTYLHCTNDRTVPLEKQQGMISRAKQAQGLLQTVKVVSGHSPFLVVPMEVAETIRRLTA